LLAADPLKPTRQRRKISIPLINNSPGKNCLVWRFGELRHQTHPWIVDAGALSNPKVATEAAASGVTSDSRRTGAKRRSILFDNDFD
jgi:hypothetical protein